MQLNKEFPNGHDFNVPKAISSGARVNPSHAPDLIPLALARLSMGLFKALLNGSRDFQG
jgi:hypothetical protein